MIVMSIMEKMGRKFTGNIVGIKSSAVLWLAVLITLIIVISPVSADQWVGGQQPETVQTGVVSGDLWFDSMYGFPGDAQSGQPNSAEKTFTIPDYTEIKWAKLYVAVYCGNMQNNYKGQVTVAFDGGQGTRNVGNELLNLPYVYEINGGSTPVWINDHCNRVTSDYIMWYDVTDKIKSRSVSASVYTDKAPGYTGMFDGRIKLITLVVAYDDGDNDEVYYWVNQGHDVHSYYVEDNGLLYTGRTKFETRDLPSEFEVDSAKLGVVHLASENGIYTFNGEAIDTISSQGTYSGYQIWDVTDSVYAEDDSEMTYTRNTETQGGGWETPGAFYKIPLALLTVKHVGEPVGHIKVESNPKEAAIFIDDEEQEAVTDSLISGLPVGTYSVCVHKDSYYDPDPVDVEVLNGETFTVSFDLEPIIGSIEISSEPEGATIILDDKDTGLKTGAVIEDVLVGTHTVAVSLEGYYELSKIVVVEEGDTATVEFELVPDIDVEDESVYGYTGKELEVYKKGSIKGGIAVFNVSRYTGLLKKGDQTEYTLDVSLPENATVKLARLYLFSTWGHDTTKREGKKPTIEATLDGSRLYLEKAHRDRKGEGIYNYVLETSCYDVSGIIGDSGDHMLSVSNTGGMNDVFALYGASLVILYEDPGLPLTSYWIAEGCDALLASDEFDTDTESCTTTADFSGKLSSFNGGTLYFISTAASGIPGDENRLAFNDYEAFNLLNGGSSDISTATVDVKPFLKSSGNELSVQSYVSGSKGDYMENRLAILTVGHSDDAGTEGSVLTEISGNESAVSDGSENEIPGSGNYPLILSGGRTSAERIIFGNGTLELYINEGTALTLPSGMAVDSITIKVPDAPEDCLYLFSIEPSGAVSDIPVLLSAALPETSGCGDLTFVYYTEESGDGQVVDSFFDTESGTLSCRISRFGLYGIAPLSGNESGNNASGQVFPLNIISGLTTSFMNMIFPEDKGEVNSVTGSPSLSSSAGNSSLPSSTGPEVIEIDPTTKDFDVAICSNPSSARISLDGEYLGKTTPSTVTLKGGTHSLVLELEGFRIYEDEFMLSQNITIYGDLQASGGPLVEERKYDGFIEETALEGIGGVYVTSYPDGAKVYVNGANTGMLTPCVFYGLKEGMNKIKVKKAGVEFPVDSKKIWVDSGCVMTVEFGQSLVSSRKADIDSIEYDGYYFTINGQMPEYKLPKVVAVDYSNSFITFHDDGKYISHNIRVFYDNELNDIMPRDYRFGKVLVESVPEGAAIYVDGYDTGYSTPYAIDGLSDGEHRIEVSKPGYIRSGKNILLTPDESEYDEKVRIILEPYLYGSLEVTSSPGGAKIYLYGKDTGKITPHTFHYMDIGGIDVKVVGDENTVTLEEVMIEPYGKTACHADLS